MVENDSNTVRAVAWSEVFPWGSLVRTFRLAIAARVLVLGAIAILITASGWGMMGLIFGTDSPATEWLKPFAACPWTALTSETVPNEPALPTAATHGFAATISGAPGMPPPAPPSEQEIRVVPGWSPEGPIPASWTLLSSPALEALQHRDISFRDMVCLLLCGLLSVAVWAYFGAAICRIAAVQLASGEQVGLGAALRYACRKWLSYCAAPLLPIGGVFLASIPVIVLGWIIYTNVGLLLGAILWPLVLVAGLLMTLLLLGLLFGWPLMWATISVEGTDSFDALSRSYAYTFQRPLHYLFYTAVAAFIGWLGWLLVQNFAAGVVWMGYWAAGWGCGAERIQMILSGDENLGSIGRFGAGAIRFWAECVKLLAVGYLFSYFWTAAVAIYFLLRHDVDATEMDEVFLDADQSEEAAATTKTPAQPAAAPMSENDEAQTPPNGA